MTYTHQYPDGTSWSACPFAGQRTGGLYAAAIPRTPLGPSPCAKRGLTLPTGDPEMLLSTSAPIVVGDARHVPLSDNSVRLVVTSPPYLALRDYGSPAEIGQEKSPADYVAALMDVMTEMDRLLTADGSVFIVIGDKYARTGGVDRKQRGGTASGDPGGRSHARLPQKGIPGVRDGSLAGLPARVALAAIDRGWIWRQEIIWRKPNPLPESVRNRCVRAHEVVLHFTKRTGYYAASVNRGGQFGHDVWDIPVGTYRDPGGTRHPAVFPEALVARIVDGWSEPGDVILDPFAGSGTTPKVAIALGRIGVGVELNPAYAAVATARCAAAASNQGNARIGQSETGD